MLKKEDKLKVRQAYDFVKDMLDLYGDVILIGSAKRYKCFERGHDFDILLKTSISAKKMIIDKIENCIEKWYNIYKIPLHIICDGTFDSQFIEEEKYMIHFLNHGSKIWLRITVAFQKSMRYLLKKSINK